MPAILAEMEKLFTICDGSVEVVKKKYQSSGGARRTYAGHDRISTAEKVGA
jgi:hypothetical protein